MSPAPRSWTRPFVVPRGSAGRPVFLVHGGPGAPGYLAPLARELAASHRVFEAWQRHSRPGSPLTVARHVDDLATLVREHLADERPVILGHSWGAMLALAAAAERRELASSLVLVGCGTFDAASREELQRRREGRLDSRFRRELARIERVPDADRRLVLLGELFSRCDAYDLEEPVGVGACDAQGHRESWQDMMRLQADGTYPAAFEAIACPVLLVQGADDPHPGPSICDSLLPFLPELVYRELPCCGHHPWLERQARDRFFSVLSEWLTGSGR